MRAECLPWPIRPRLGQRVLDAAPSIGVEAALRKHGVAGLIERGVLDVAIDQDPEGQVVSALQHLLHACGVVEQAPPQGPNAFRVHCRENLA